MIAAPRSPGSTAPTHAEPSASSRTQDSSQNRISLGAGGRCLGLGSRLPPHAAAAGVANTRCTAQVISSDVNGLVT